MKHAAIPGEHAEWAALYMAGALTHEEQACYEEHLAAGCAECRGEVIQFGVVLTGLADAVAPVQPDPRTKDALLRRIAVDTVSPLRRHVAGTPAEEPGRPLPIERAGECLWEATDVEGVRIRVLAVDRSQNQFTALVRMVPGAAYPSHVHDGPEQCYVLEGDLHVGDQVMGPGDYQYAPAGSRHGVQRTAGGCLLLITSSLTDVFGE